MKLASFLALWLFPLRCLVIVVGGTLIVTGRLFAAGGAATRTSYTFPFTPLAYGIPTVQAKINDNIVGTFLIDTGASANFITASMIVKLGLKPTKYPQGKEPFFLDGKPATMVSPIKLQVGTLIMQGGTFLVVKAKTMSYGNAVDGVISMQLLRYFAPDFDFVRHQITMWFPNGLTDSEVKQVGFTGATKVPLNPNIPDTILYDPVKAGASPDAFWRLVYSVPVQISDGVHTSQQNLTLDTGSAATIFPADVLRSLKLETYGMIKEPNIVSGEESVDTVIVPYLSLGDLHLLDHPVGIYQDKTGKATPVLGLDVLSGYRILMDFGAGKMYLKPPSPLPLPNITVKPVPNGAILPISPGGQNN